MATTCWSFSLHFLLPPQPILYIRCPLSFSSMCSLQGHLWIGTGTYFSWTLESSAKPVIFVFLPACVSFIILCWVNALSRRGNVLSLSFTITQTPSVRLCFFSNFSLCGICFCCCYISFVWGFFPNLISRLFSAPPNNPSSNVCIHLKITHISQ